jgi:hypothetical protein
LYSYLVRGFYQISTVLPAFFIGIRDVCGNLAKMRGNR